MHDTFPDPQCKVAVIVNDMSELNIDAALVAGKKLVQTKEALVQLQVGVDVVGMVDGDGQGAVGRRGWGC